MKSTHRRILFILVPLLTLLAAGMVFLAIYSPLEGLIALQDSPQARAAWERVLPALNPPGRIGSARLAWFQTTAELDALLDGPTTVILVDASDPATLVHLRQRQKLQALSIQRGMDSSLAAISAALPGLVPVLQDPWIAAQVLPDPAATAAPPPSRILAAGAATDARSALSRLTLGPVRTDNAPSWGLDPTAFAPLQAAQNARRFQTSASTWTWADTQAEFAKSGNDVLYLPLSRFRALPLEERMKLQLRPVPAIEAMAVCVPVDYFVLALTARNDTVLADSLLRLVSDPAIQLSLADSLGYSPVNPASPILDTHDRLARDVIRSAPIAPPVHWFIGPEHATIVDQAAIQALTTR